MRPKLLAIALAKASLEVLPSVLRMVVKGRVKRLARPRLPKGMTAVATATRAKLHPPLAVAGGRHTMPPPGRRRGQLIVVAHIASNEHVEMYVYDPDGSGTCHNVGVVTVPEGTLKRNTNGWFTAATKEEARSIFRNKAAGRDFIAFSTDHRLDEAMCSWNTQEDGPSGYGAGPIREVIHVENVEIYSNGSTVEFTSWWLNPYQRVFLHVVFSSSSDRKGTVGVIGYKQLPEPQFEDRLHLTYDRDDVLKLQRNIGPDGRASIKIDGAATHFRIDKHGARYFSPRTSKQTGKRIEYSAKLGNLQDVASDEPIQGMGELVFVDLTTGEFLKAHEVGGVLNANRLPDDHLEPRLYVYRIDQVGRRRVIDEPYWEVNRLRCEAIAAEHPQLTVPDWVPLDRIEDTRHAEGVVAVPANTSIVEGGRKLKWRGDATDVVVTRVEFEPGDNGGIAGVVWYEDPSTGREYKIASGFTREEKEAMMADPESYEGEVMMVSGFANGHSQRAARFEGFHQDKDGADMRRQTWRT